MAPQLSFSSNNLIPIQGFAVLRIVKYNKMNSKVYNFLEEKPQIFNYILLYLF